MEAKRFMLNDSLIKLKSTLFQSFLASRVHELEQEKATRVDEGAFAALRETSTALEQRYRDSVRQITQLERRVNELELEMEESRTQCVNMQL